MLLIEAVNTSLSSSRLKYLDIIISHRTFSYFKIISILSKTSSRYHMVPSCFLITPRKFSTHYHLDVPLKTSFHSHAFSIDILIKFSISLIDSMSFGWYRAEVIGAMASVVMIWVITGILVWLAIGRLISGDYEVDAKIMLITSGLAILVNVM